MHTRAALIKDKIALTSELTPETYVWLQESIYGWFNSFHRSWLQSGLELALKW